ncbi:MAG: alginate export family protein [Candidatus Omnitrophota bacterium]|nr:MAG: alginate export family protein [Candidatus Omnitrophota bacterium]
MRLLTAIGVAALVIAFCVPAFAETQSVKVSGDIAITHVYQRNLDLNKDDGDATLGASDTSNFFMQQVGLNVDADLTDNVATFVRIISERDWDYTDGDFNVNLDEAYVTLKEFLYAPLTLKLGRQNIWFGKGLIIGNSAVWDVDGNLGADELSGMNAFDAIRGTLDYDPWTIDLVYAKIKDTVVDVHDDIDLYGVNVGYLFDKYEAEAEAYYFLKWDQSQKVVNHSTDEVHTLGLRGSLVPYDNMNIWAEGASQLGRYHDLAVAKKSREAWALDVGVDYKWVETPWTPKAGAEYQYLSGDNYEDSGDYEGWDPMYKGKEDSLIREYMNVVYATDYTVARDRLNGNTNQHQIKGMLAIEPITDVTLDGELSYFWLDKEISASNTSDEIGLELDGALSYDYTEDVSFVVRGGVFWPGDVFPSGQDDRASKLISAVKVEF